VILALECTASSEESSLNSPDSIIRSPFALSALELDLLSVPDVTIFLWLNLSAGILILPLLLLPPPEIMLKLPPFMVRVVSA